MFKIRFRTLSIAILSLTLGSLVWFRDPAPVWTSSDYLNISPLGYSSDGQLVTLAKSVNSAWRLQIWDVATGKSLRQQELPDSIRRKALGGWGEMTPDGEWVILRDENPGTNGMHSLFVISWRDGRERCPPIPVKHSNPSRMSPDGRYKQRFIDLANREQLGIVDLSTGETLYPSVFSIQFSPDSQQWASLEDEGNQKLVVFRSLADGREFGRQVLPAAPWQKWSRLGASNGDRLEIETERKIPLPRKGTESETWSFRVAGTALSDMQLEPALWGRMEYLPSGDVPQTWLASGNGWAIRSSDGHRIDPRLVDSWNWCVGWIPGNPFRWHPIERSHWQLVSRQTGEPLHRPIVLVGPQATESPDGGWLATGGQRLHVWRLPPRSPYWTTLCAASLPWLLILIRRRKPLVHSTNQA